MNLNISIDEQQEFIAEVGEFIKLTKDKYRAGLVYEVVGKRQHRRKILYDVRRPFKRVEGIKYAETYEEPQYIGGVLGSTGLMANAIKVKNLRGDEYEQEH